MEESAYRVLGGKEHSCNEIKGADVPKDGVDVQKHGAGNVGLERLSVYCCHQKYCICTINHHLAVLILCTCYCCSDNCVL